MVFLKNQSVEMGTTLTFWLTFKISTVTPRISKPTSSLVDVGGKHVVGLGWYVCYGNTEYSLYV